MPVKIIRKAAYSENDLSKIFAKNEMEGLDLYINEKVSFLPKEIGQLKNLRILYLSAEKISSLPNEIEELKNLETLIIHNSKLTGLPGVIGSLKNLKRLYIKGKIKDLPEEIGKLTALENLDISGHDHSLCELPEEFCNLKNLKFLNLNYNNIKQLSSQFGNLKKLQTLNLRCNNLTALSDTFGQLKNLKILNLESNKFKKFPEKLLQLKKIKLIDLSENKLNSLPEGIGQLKSLNIFSLGNDYESEYNDLTGKMVKRYKGGKIHAGNQIKNLPDSFFDLTNLIEFDISYNKITQIPNAMKKLVSLESLNLRGNPIDNIPKEIIDRGKHSIFEHCGLAEKNIFIEEESLSTANTKKIPVACKRRIDEFQKEIKRKIKNTRISEGDKDYNEDILQLLKEFVPFIQGKNDEIPAGDRVYHDFRFICRVFAPFQKWTFVDRRILAFITNSDWAVRIKDSDDYTYDGFFKLFSYWVWEQVKKESSDQLFEDIMKELKRFKNYSNDFIINYILLETNNYLFKKDKITSIGNFVVSEFSEKQISLMKKMEASSLDEIFLLFSKSNWSEFENLVMQNKKKSLYAPVGFLSEHYNKDKSTYKKVLLHYLDIVTSKTDKSDLEKIMKA